MYAFFYINITIRWYITRNSYYSRQNKAFISQFPHCFTIFHYFQLSQIDRQNSHTVTTKIQTIYQYVTTTTTTMMTMMTTMMLMMINILPCVFLTLTLSISDTSAFSISSSVSSSIALRQIRFELSSTQLFDNDIELDLINDVDNDIDIDIDNDNDNDAATAVSLHYNKGVLSEKTVTDGIAVDVPPQQQQILSTDNSNNNALVVIDSNEPTESLPYDKIKKIALTTDTKLKTRYLQKIKMLWNTDEKLKKRYAIVLGRLAVVCISFTPLVYRHQMMHKEEYLIQLFLLGLSIQPLKKSVALAKCIKNSETGVEECQLEFEDLEDAFDIDKPKKQKRL